jgi:glycyl-tRNA synthetase
MDNKNLEAIVSLCKRRGFIYQGSEIYGGLAGTWDYGPLGVALKRNITNLWWDFFVDKASDAYGIDSTILMNSNVWEASGHVSTFHDPLIQDLKTKKIYRADHLLEDNNVNPEGMSLEEMYKQIVEKGLKSPEGNELGNPAKFNLMFKTSIGPAAGNDSAVVYLRPETAQGMFVNFKNVVDSLYPDLPFGLAQIGRNFRNEISPRDFIFRSREFEIMEIEYFIEPDKWEEEFEKLLNKSREWYTKVLGLSADNIHELEVGESDRAHYSNRTVDFEYKYPIGLKEIGGLAYRGDFDLKNHQEASGKSLEYTVKGTQNRFIPHVIEPTFGVDRNVLAVICEAYKEDEINGEKRTYLALSSKLAPIKAAIFPLLKNKPELVKLAREIHSLLATEIGPVMWDDNGNIGKRYRRQDEIGTPYCITIDFDSLEDGTLTIRNRNTTEQTRISKEDLIKKLKADFKDEIS